MEKVVENFNEKLKHYLIENLNKIGHSFKDDFEFQVFAEKNITKVSTNEIHRNECSFFINYRKETELCIGAYFEEDEVEIVDEGLKIKKFIIFSPLSVSSRTTIKHLKHP